MKTNAINLYKHFCELEKNPTGKDAQERKIVRENARKAKEDMENHFRTAPKYLEDGEIKKLLNSEDKKNTKKTNSKKGSD
jgi:hypothetical protein